MLQSIVGPPSMGVADLGSSERSQLEGLKNPKGEGPDSFGRALQSQEKGSPPRTATKEKTSGRIVDKPEKSSRVEVGRKEAEPQPEKVQATKDDGAKKEIGGISQRQKAILKFMDSFESEFGIPPTRLVEAMANLDSAQQVESPEITADQVIDQLDLDDQDADQAKAMYLGLLTQLAQIDNSPKLPVVPVGKFGISDLEGGTSRERMASSLQKREALNMSLDSMNEKFWMKGDLYRKDALSAQEPLVDKLAQLSLQNKLDQAPEYSAAIDPRSVDPQLSQNIKATLPTGAFDKAELSETSNLKDEDLEDLLTKSESPAPVSKDSEIVDSSPIAPAVESNFQGNSFESSQQQASGEELAAKDHRRGEGVSREAIKGADKQSFKGALSADGGLVSHGMSPLKQETASLNSIAASAIPTPNETPRGENEANIRQLMNQAQYLIKKGGGEMKVQMSPEGLGQVHLRVMVENGKVNVQMAADTQEAKKTIEGSLSELKNSLAAHKLSMDHIKVDVVNSMNTDNNAQNQMNQDLSGRDQTRQFWNRFSENFGSPSQQREGFADIPSMRGYPRKRTDQPMEPVTTESVRRTSGLGKGQGLNLVA